MITIEELKQHAVELEHEFGDWVHRFVARVEERFHSAKATSNTGETAVVEDGPKDEPAAAPAEQAAAPADAPAAPAATSADGAPVEQSASTGLVDETGSGTVSGAPAPADTAAPAAAPTVGGSGDTPVVTQ
jgi:hypothetical protein